MESFESESANLGEHSTHLPSTHFIQLGGHSAQTPGNTKVKLDKQFRQVEGPEHMRHGEIHFRQRPYSVDV